MIKSSAWVALLSLVLSGCQAAPAITSPASTSAKAITDLLWIFFGISALVFVVIEGLLLFVVFRYRHNGNKVTTEELPKQVEGNPRLELIWTLVPALSLLILFIVSVGTLRALVEPPTDSAAVKNIVNVRAIGHQWWWEFEYSDEGILTADEMHVPVNSVVYVSVDSADVIHSFWVPQMGGKIDVVPGHTNNTWFQPTEIGTFTGECSEFCGGAHAMMRLDLVVESQADYEAWLTAQKAPSVKPTGDAILGEKVFFEEGCSGCHQINGTPADGLIGPNLTHFASRKSIGGKVLDNTPENLAFWLGNPAEYKPGVLMPKLNLTPERIKLLVVYLDSLK